MGHPPFGAPKVMKNALCPATTLLGSATLPFVISTEAKRSGEISVLMTSLLWSNLEPALWPKSLVF
jgi:hypothetical protein